MIRFLTTTCLTFALAQGAYALTLQEALIEAYENNPTILKAKFDKQSSYHDVTQARSGFLPNVDITASASRSEREPKNGTETVTHPHVGAVNVKQNLFTGGQTFSSYRSAQKGYESSQSNALVVTQNILVSLVQAYTDVLKDEELLRLQKNQVKVLSTQLDATKSRFKQGEVTKTDVKQAEARVAAAKAAYTQALGTLTTSKTVLKNILGSVPEGMSWPKTTFEFPESVDLVKAQVLESHPRVKSARSQLEANEYLVKRASGQFLPSVVATASFSKNDDISGQNYDDKVVGVSLSMPLFVGGSNVSQLKQAKMNRSSAKELYEQTRRDVEQELVDAFQTYGTAQASLVSFLEAEEAAGLAAEGIVRESELGERDVLDVLDAQQEYLESSVNVFTAKRNVVLSAYRLKAAMGELTAP